MREFAACAAAAPGIHPSATCSSPADPGTACGAVIEETTNALTIATAAMVTAISAAPTKRGCRLRGMGWAITLCWAWLMFLLLVVAAHLVGASVPTLGGATRPAIGPF